MLCIVVLISCLFVCLKSILRECLEKKDELHRWDQINVFNLCHEENRCCFLLSVKLHWTFLIMRKHLSARPSTHVETSFRDSGQWEFFARSAGTGSASLFSSLLPWYACCTARVHLQVMSWLSTSRDVPGLSQGSSGCNNHTVQCTVLMMQVFTWR